MGQDREFQEFMNRAFRMPEIFPERFETKRRAIGLGRRLGLWTVGMAIGWVIDLAITGTPENPFLLWFGMASAAALIHFDPPAIRTIHSFKNDRAG